MRRYRFIFLGILLASIGFVVAGCTSSSVPKGTYDAFAQCLTDKGAKMYGAYWCTHCKDQKEMFADSVSKITYIECAQPGDPNSVTQQCKEAGVEGYPTWIFADGSKLTGTQALSALAEKTGCTLPNVNK